MLRGKQLWTYCKWISSYLFILAFIWPLGLVKKLKWQKQNRMTPVTPAVQAVMYQWSHSPNNGLFTSMFPAVHTKNHYPAYLQSSVRWASSAMGIWSATDKSRKFLEVWLHICYSIISHWSPNYRQASFVLDKQRKILFASSLWQGCYSCLLLLCRSFGEVLNCPKIIPHS